MQHKNPASKKPMPLSPHLQIYKPQLTSVLSILHRLTGLGLTLALLGLVLMVVLLAMGPGSYNSALEIVRSGFGLVFLCAWAFAFFYHLGNGIRHLFWDIGWGFEMPQVIASGWTVVGFSILATAYTAYLLFGEVS